MENYRLHRAANRPMNTITYGVQNEREMSHLYKTYCRVYQRAWQIASYFVPWHKPELLEGKNSIEKLPSLIEKNGIKIVLIVTDKGISSLGLMITLLEGLEKKNIQYSIYDESVPNPTTDNIEKALTQFYANSCEAIVAFGGGSSLDCAKGVGARIARPKKSCFK